MGRWDWVYDLKSQPVGDYLLDKLAENLEADVKHFPPQVDGWEDEATQKRFEPLLATGRQPSELAVRTAIWLVQADLRREFEAVDEFMRNGGLDDRLGSPEDRELCRFLWRFLEDKVLAFAEASQSRFKRAELAEAMTKLEKRLYRVIQA
jgi:hypothetical protein